MKNKILYFIVMIVLMLSMTSCKKNTVMIKMITFNGAEILYQEVEEGEKVSNLPTPTKEGYQFGGWFYDYNFTKKVELPCSFNQNITLYAGWYNHLEYVLEEETDTYTVTGINYPAFDIVIPAEFKGKPVTKIAESAFEASIIIKTVSLPDTIKVIESYAFANCSNLTSINFPDSIESIGVDIFDGCSKLYYQTENDIRYLNNWLVDGTQANMSSGTINENTVGIFPGAFEGNETLVTFTVPSKIKNIYSDTFKGSGLTSIVIGDNVEFIDPTAFAETTNLTEIKVSNNNTHFFAKDGVLFNKDVTELLIYPTSRPNLEYTMPSTIKYISERAFMYNEYLTKLNLSNNLSKIGDYAFLGSKALTNITFNDKLESIGKEAFRFCDNIETLHIPESVQYLGEGIFSDLVKLEELSIPFVYNDEVHASISYLFNNNVPKQLTTLNILGGSEIKEDSLLGIHNICNLSIGSSITKIEEGAFIDGISINNITVDKSNQYYKAERNIVYSKDGKLLIYYAAGNRNEIINIGGYVEVICKNAIIGNETVQIILINDGVKEIHFNAFNNLPNLVQLIIPTSVTTAEQDICIQTQNVKIYTYLKTIPENWSEGWNTYNYPVVWDAKFPTINIVEREFPIRIGETYQLIYDVIDAPEEYEVVMSIEDETIIKVEDGVITGLSEGMTIITLWIENYPTSEITIVVHVVPNE